MTTRTKARVEVTLEISCGDTWGPECQLSQVYQQAEKAALGALHKGLGPTGFKVVSKPVVTAVTSANLPGTAHSKSIDPAPTFILSEGKSADTRCGEWQAEIVVDANLRMMPSILIHGDTKEQVENLRAFILSRCAVS